MRLKRQLKRHVRIPRGWTGMSQRQTKSPWLKNYTLAVSPWPNPPLAAPSPNPGNPKMTADAVRFTCAT